MKKILAVALAGILAVILIGYLAISFKKEPDATSSNSGGESQFYDDVMASVSESEMTETNDPYEGEKF